MNQIYTSDLLSFQKRLAPTVDSDVVIDRPKTEILPEPYVITHERIQISDCVAERISLVGI